MSSLLACWAVRPVSRMSSTRSPGDLCQQSAAACRSSAGARLVQKLRKRCARESKRAASTHTGGPRCWVRVKKKGKSGTPPTPGHSGVIYGGPTSRRSHPDCYGHCSSAIGRGRPSSSTWGINTHYAGRIPSPACWVPLFRHFFLPNPPAGNRTHDLHVRGSGPNLTTGGIPRTGSTRACI